ncbi:MAG: sigma-70 family RNA polymerase sigma factor [Bacteroidales bacterium]|nr:sigma-70 family RNA polymerase sigma factor [Bacteroidales bacterium]
MNKLACNEEIITLTRSSTNFLNEAQDLIESIASKFITSGSFRHEEKDDLIQTINEELLYKMPKIRQQFLGISSFRGYLSVVIQNICREKIRRNKSIRTTELTDIHFNQSEELNPEHVIVIQQEVERLKKLLLLYNKQRTKIILCLKLKFRIPLNICDLSTYLGKINKKEYKEFKEKLKNYNKIKDVDIYEAIIPLFNKFENKNNNADSLRKWIKLKINELIELLNGDPPISSFDEDTLQILFEKYISLNP